MASQTSRTKKSPKAQLQSARLGYITRELAEHPAIGIKPSQLIRLLQEAEQGNLKRQSELFMDMEEKDAHIFAELSKRKRALLGLQWRIVAPDKATAAEIKATDILTEVLENSASDLLFDLLDGIGHGFAAVEIQWQYESGMWLPIHFYHRPHGWFTLDQHDKNKLALRTNGSDTLDLQPFGWIIHKPKARSGMLARAGLFRVLAMPYLLKHYALHNLSEFLEVYGHPLKVGKYNSGIEESEKEKLLRLLKNLGHSAAGIFPEGMDIEFIEAAKGSESPFKEMQRLCDEATSKAILGGTLTSNTSESGGGAHALGKVHNEVRRDLMESDARQLAATLNRDLITPFCLFNFAAIRPPRFVFDLQETADITGLSQALPALVNCGVKIPEQWVYTQLGIPQPEKDEAILTPHHVPQAFTRQAAHRQQPLLDRQGQRWQTMIDQSLPDHPNSTTINAPLLAIISQAKDHHEALELLSRVLPNLHADELTEELSRLLMSAEMAGRLSFQKIG